MNGSPKRVPNAAAAQQQQREYHEVTGDIPCPSMLQGIDHLRDPRLNKVRKTILNENQNLYLNLHLLFQGLAFTLEERQVLGIHGLQPARFKSQEEQLELCNISIERYKEDLNKYLYLVDLQVRIERDLITILLLIDNIYIPLLYL